MGTETRSKEERKLKVKEAEIWRIFGPRRSDLENIRDMLRYDLCYARKDNPNNEIIFVHVASGKFKITHDRWESYAMRLSEKTTITSIQLRDIIIKEGDKWYTYRGKAAGYDLERFTLKQVANYHRWKFI